ncbi:hypothetical protein [Vibrio gazogenes]|uniref:Uncharacterized protein n=1 Tax=Vibrio gazogenes TaxID=687 RepID=A0A1Z2SG59_VIBGA|nr:hypothetical protein [Vibrio gazogenes]ASA56180.1 hypothetical protein BSQ33_11025 [Vibrio gazogenes]
MDDTDRKPFVLALDTKTRPPQSLAIDSFQQYDVASISPPPNRIQDDKPDITRDTRVTIRALDSQYQTGNYRCQKGQHIRAIQIFSTQCLLSHSSDNVMR